MKTITFDKSKVLRVNSEGLEYRADDGQTCFIDFKVCGGGGKNPYRYVGSRDFQASPPYFQFPTQPPTRFVFGSVNRQEQVRSQQASAVWYEDFRWLEHQIRKAGWMTIDLA